MIEGVGALASASPSDGKARARSFLRGATLVEYALIVVAIVLIAAGSFKLLGSALNKRSSVVGDTVAGSAEGAGGGSGATGGTGGSRQRGGGGGVGGDKATVATKVSVGGVGGAAGENGVGGGASRSGRTAGAGGGEGSGSGGGDDPGDLTEGFTTKRWFALGLLVAGLLAIGYVVASMRRAKNAAANALAKGGRPRA